MRIVATAGNTIITACVFPPNEECDCAVGKACRSLTEARQRRHLRLVKEMEQVNDNLRVS